MNIRSALLLAVATLAVAGGGITAYTRAASGATDEDAESSILSEENSEDVLETVQNTLTSADIAIAVTGAPVVHGTMTIYVEASGQAEAWRRVAISPLVPGRISELPVEENRSVRRGELLVALDPMESELRLREAEAQLRTATASWREMTLLDDRIPEAAIRMVRDSLVRSRSGMEAAEVAVQRAQIELERTRMTSPITGRVANVSVIPGEWVTAGRDLMTIMSLDTIRVEAAVLEREIGFLTSGKRARVTFAALPGEEFEGVIERLNPLVETGTRTARAGIRVLNPDGRILPGMYARVVLDGREFPDRVMVPREAILERDRREMLFVWDEESGRAKWRYVTTGLTNGTQVEIVPGRDTEMVQDGEIVLTSGHYSLVHDARVTVEVQ
jgi:membrane fusion protein (multidrug efflux system)